MHKDVFDKINNRFNEVKELYLKNSSIVNEAENSEKEKFRTLRKKVESLIMNYEKESDKHIKDNIMFDCYKKLDEMERIINSILNDKEV